MEVREVIDMFFHAVKDRSEDGWMMAEVPALPGCVSKGKVEKEALENIKDAIHVWLWAEDQKAVSSMSQHQKKNQIVVAI